jgi:2-dehydro-3-deoxyphosphogluconate aldolase/(4S)-4-hydroxy-2-oxoglutarate aldolase
MNNFFKNRLMPALTFTHEADVLPVTEAILAGGLNVMEITFRTEVAAKAIELVRKNFPEMKVGAGTLLSVEQVNTAINAGAFFGVAPGLNNSVVQFASEKSFPFIPGIITASELEKALELGCYTMKLFPCDLSGGISLIKALQGPYAHTGVKFIPMGGINLTNLHQYMAYDIVLAAGGSWIASAEMIAQKNYNKIKENVEQSIVITSGINIK